jgi:hypothetical protein
MTPSESPSEFQADGNETIDRTTSHESNKSLSLPSTQLAVTESEQMLLQARGGAIGEDTWNQFIAYPSTPYVPTPPPPSSNSSGTADDSLDSTANSISPQCSNVLPFGLTNLDIDTALSSQSWTATQCSCLAMLLALLDDVSNRLLRIQEESLDEALKYTKQAFTQIEGLFGCSSCMMRSDYGMLLAVVTARLTEMVEEVALALQTPLLAKDKAGGNLGSYSLDGDEYDYLLRTLFRYHVEKRCDLVRRMKQTATTTGRGAQVSQFKESERRLLSILETSSHN